MRESDTAEYKAWKSMRRRCLTKGNPSYPNYGGRGIKICERWNVYANFLADMGRRPGPELSLHRVDGNGDYTPENCKWATTAEQASNRRPRQRNPRAIDNRTRFWVLKYASAALSFGA